MESVATCSVDGRNWAAVARITLTSEGLFTEFFKNLDFQCNVDQNNCRNGGNCKNQDGVNSCDCENTGYKGKDCTDDVNECDNSDWCKNKAVCDNIYGSFTCDCKNTRFEGSELCDVPKYSEYGIS